MAILKRRKLVNSIIAAAAFADPNDRTTTPRYETWQDEGWAMFNTLGEFRQGVMWLGNVLSRARLVAAYAPDNPGDEPQPIDDVNDEASVLVSAIGGGMSGQAELLRSAAVHLTVPGEGWLMAETSDESTSWKFYSADELRVRTEEGKKIYQVQVASGQWVSLSNENLPVRVWRQHDRHHWLADSSTRAALPIMRRLELLNRHIDAISQSRLASNGVYWIPTEIVFPENPSYPDAQDPFIAQFMDMGITAIKTPGSAAAALPFIARAPGDWIQKIRHDTFSSEYEKELLANREFEIRRLSTAMDVPPEVLLGMSQMNHWGAWQVEESALKTTAMSLLELVCGALTQGYLEPGLGIMQDQATREAMVAGEPITSVAPSPDEHRKIVWYDISELSVRPDRSQDALSLMDRFVVGPDTALRETGLSDADLADDEELKHMLGLKLVQDPATCEIGMELLGIKTTATVASAPSSSSSPSAPPAAESGTPGTANRPPPGANPNPPAVPSQQSPSSVPSQPPRQAAARIQNGK